MHFQTISSLIILMTSFLYLVACGTQRSFYRTRGKVLMNGNTIHNSSVFSSEDCLGECYLTPTCNTFNTIEETPYRYTCEMFSNERTCDVVTGTDVKASVYFSSVSCKPVFRFKVSYFVNFMISIYHVTLYRVVPKINAPKVIGISREIHIF